MANKQQVKRSMKRLRRVKMWHLVLLLMVLLVLSATFLRLNNVGMTERRRAVLSADKAGNMEQIRQRIADLQQYSSAHMNADTGPIYLQEQYNRDVKAALNASMSTTNRAGQTANAKADAVCKPRFRSWSIEYVRCVYEELGKLSSTNTGLQTAKMPDTSLYHYNFSAPLWSPDFAGWTILLTGVVISAILGRIVGMIILRIMLRVQYRAAK